jgi:uncharacterized phiE125 gp8 family phage protein
MPDLPAASVDTLRELLRLDDATGGEYAEEAYLNQLLLAASDYAAGYLNRSLITTEYRRVYDTSYKDGGLSPICEARKPIMLPYPPVAEVTAVYTVDSDGNTTAVTGYYTDFDSEPGRLYITDSSVYTREIASLKVDYTAGYGDTYSSVPDGIQQGILQHAAYLYEHRGDCDAEESAKRSGATVMYNRYKVVVTWG